MTGEGVSSHLAVRLAVLPDDLYPVQHVLPVLRLQQVFAEVLGGQPQGMFSFGLAVRDVHQAAPDADRLLVLGRTSDRGPSKHRLPLVLIEEERVGAKHRKDSLPRTHAAAHLLRRTDEIWCESLPALNVFSAFNYFLIKPGVTHLALLCEDLFEVQPSFSPYVAVRDVSQL